MKFITAKPLDECIAILREQVAKPTFRSWLRSFRPQISKVIGTITDDGNFRFRSSKDYWSHVYKGKILKSGDHKILEGEWIAGFNSLFADIAFDKEEIALFSRDYLDAHQAEQGAAANP